ncbi:MAG: hypothetical protein ACRDH2_12365 [Anaerolineales bacterium]
MFVSHLQETRPQATAHLATTMSFLQLSTAELEVRLLKELDQNPALELVEELRCPECGKRLTRLPCLACASPRDDSSPVVCLSMREPASFRPDRDDAERELYSELEAPERLDEHILRQVGPSLSPAERPLAAYILARLDEHGLLPESAAEIAAFKRARLSDVERVLKLLQQADPPGIAARTPQESLLIQLDCLADSTDPKMIRDLRVPRAIIQHHFNALGRLDYARIARGLRVPRASVEAAARFIHRNLTPYPALAFWGEGRQSADGGAALRNPDVNISLFNRSVPYGDGPLLVEVFTPLSGWLRVNPEFKAALADCALDERERWSRAVLEAGLVAKCLQQRNHTMRRLMQIIAAEQRSFILGGDGDLLPFTRAQVAKQLGVHESTISRAVAGKTAALPDGRIVPLAKFFDRSLSVRDRVRLIVETEMVSDHPFTDDQIAVALGRQGVRVARRTVAKYRKMLGILPASVRGRAQARLRPRPTRQQAPGRG